VIRNLRNSLNSGNIFRHQEPADGKNPAGSKKCLTAVRIAV